MMHSFSKLILCSAFCTACCFLSCVNPSQPQPNKEESDSEKLSASEAPKTEEKKPAAAISEDNPAEAEKIRLEKTSTEPQKMLPNSPNKAPSPPEKEAKTAKTEQVKKDMPVEEKSAPKEIVEKVKTALPKTEALEEPPMPEPTRTGVDHSPWNDFLKKYVSSTGNVDYGKIKGNKATLEAYLTLLSENKPSSDWSRNERMAYWINAYNAFTIKRIIDNYPLKSITDLDGGKTWDVKWIKLGGSTYSLNQIENEILRPQFGDARIHFAVNCAAKSCPPLLNQAFTSNTLNSQLESQAKKFINNPKYTSITESSAEVSKIFEWYAKDFGDLKVYLNKYSTTKLNEGGAITYKEYDWSLNGG